MKKSKLTTKQIVLTGMMTAVLAVLSIVTIPLPTGVPVTLQTFAMAFCGYVLGWKLGGASSALYLILGAIGVPVYAGMSGGFGALLGPAGGFIFGFIPMAMLCGAGIKKGFPANHSFLELQVLRYVTQRCGTVFHCNRKHDPGFLPGSFRSVHRKRCDFRCSS